MHLSALTFGTPIVLFSSSQVVQETILVGNEEKRKCHLKLADFFVDHCKDDDRVIFMAPEQLKQAGEKKTLLEFLRNANPSKNRPGFWKNNYYKVSCILNLPTTTHLNQKCNFLAFLDSGFVQIFGERFFIKLKVLSNTNLEASWKIKMEKGRSRFRSKTPVFRLPTLFVL